MPPPQNLKNLSAEELLKEYTDELTRSIITHGDWRHLDQLKLELLRRMRERPGSR